MRNDGRRDTGWLAALVLRLAALVLVAAVLSHRAPSASPQPCADLLAAERAENVELRRLLEDKTRRALLAEAQLRTCRAGDKQRGAASRAATPMKMLLQDHRRLGVFATTDAIQAQSGPATRALLQEPALPRGDIF